jgi:hypothetical protein
MLILPRKDVPSATIRGLVAFHFADCLASTRSSLRNHLLSHNIEMAKRKAPSEPSTSTPTTAKKPKTSQPSVFHYLKRESLGELCAAEDGFSIHAITKSFAIREFITKRGYKMARSRATVR